MSDLDLERPDIRGTPAQIFRNSRDIGKYRFHIVTWNINKQGYPHHTTEIKATIVKVRLLTTQYKKNLKK